MKRVKLEDKRVKISTRRAPHRSSSVDIEIVDDSLEFVESCSEEESPEIPLAHIISPMHLSGIAAKGMQYSGIPTSGEVFSLVCHSKRFLTLCQKTHSSSLHLPEFLRILPQTTTPLGKKV